MSKGVLIKPLVARNMSQYFDGYGNGRNPKDYTNDLNVSNINMLPVKPTKDGTLALQFRALVKSEEERDPNNSTGNMNKVKPKAAKRHISYLVTVEFQDVKFKEAESAHFSLKWKMGKREVFTGKPSISSKPVMIKCQCRDFVSRWEYPLSKKGGLWPNNVFTKYTRKTKFNPMLPPHPTQNPPYANPDEKMGYCKHIKNLLNFLVDSDLIQNR
jgi:hypothetical protein